MTTIGIGLDTPTSIPHNLSSTGTGNYYTRVTETVDNIFKECKKLFKNYGKTTWKAINWTFKVIKEKWSETSSTLSPIMRWFKPLEVLSFGLDAEKVILEGKSTFNAVKQHDATTTGLSGLNTTAAFAGATKSALIIGDLIQSAFTGAAIALVGEVVKFMGVGIVALALISATIGGGRIAYFRYHLHDNLTKYQHNEQEIIDYFKDKLEVSERDKDLIRDKLEKQGLNPDLLEKKLQEKIEYLTTKKKNSFTLGTSPKITEQVKELIKNNNEDDAREVLKNVQKVSTRKICLQAFGILLKVASMVGCILLFVSGVGAWVPFAIAAIATIAMLGSKVVEDLLLERNIQLNRTQPLKA